MRRFMKRHCLRLAVNFGCFAFLLAPATREYGILVIGFMVGLAVEPWIQLFEDRQKDMQFQIDVMTEAARRSDSFKAY